MQLTFFYISVIRILSLTSMDLRLIVQTLVSLCTLPEMGCQQYETLLFVNLSLDLWFPSFIVFWAM